MKKSDIIYSAILGVLMFLALIYTKPEHTPEKENPLIDSLKTELKQCKLQNGTKYRALMIVNDKSKKNEYDSLLRVIGKEN